MASIELKNLKKAYGDAQVIRGIDMQIEHGDFCVFVGPSGCGKSTLLRMISGLEPITSGDIEIEGEVVNNIPAADRGLAMVFQSYALYPHMTVKQNLSFGLENIQTPKAQIEEKIDAVSSMLQIDMLLERRPKDLSGGQRQRVAIGRAIVRDPKVFLFDEPLSNLDAELRVDMRGEISALHKRLGNTMIYVTHDQVEAMTMADRIAVFNAGIIEQVGTPLELYQHPVNRFVAGFIGSPKMNFIELKQTKEDGATCLGVRPEHFQITTDAGIWSGKVGVVEHLGSETFLHVQVDGIGTLTVKANGDCPLSYGDDISLSADQSKILRFNDQGMTLPSKGNQ